MALIKCPECGKEISNQAGSCPNCGNPIKNKKKSGTSNVLVVGIVLIVLRVIFAFFTHEIELVGHAHLAIGRVDEYVLKMYFVQGLGGIMSFVGFILIIIGIVLTIKNSRK